MHVTADRDPMSDEEILLLLRHGRGEEAFERVLATYRRRVHALAYGILRDRDAAEDVAQDVFVRLWKVLPRYDGRAQLSTWIYAITRNASISALRKRRPEDSLSEPAVMDDVEARVSADAPVQDDGTGAALARLVAQLPDKQRLAVTLYYLEERSVEEVAAMLALPVNTVKTHLHRARARLATALGAADSRENAA